MPTTPAAQPRNVVTESAIVCLTSPRRCERI